MAYDTEKQPYVRDVPRSEPEALIGFIDEELRKLDVTLARINDILDEIDTRLTAGGL